MAVAAKDIAMKSLLSIYMLIFVFLFNNTNAIALSRALQPVESAAILTGDNNLQNPVRLGKLEIQKEKKLFKVVREKYRQLKHFIERQRSLLMNKGRGWGIFLLTAGVILAMLGGLGALLAGLTLEIMIPSLLVLIGGFVHGIRGLKFIKDDKKKVGLTPEEKRKRFERSLLAVVITACTALLLGLLLFSQTCFYCG